METPQQRWRKKNKEHLRERHRAWRRANPDYYRNYYRKNRRSAIDSVIRSREKKYLAAAGRPRPDTCEVCGSGGKICFDHCHTSSAFRGWICSDCNIAIGVLKDNPIRLRKLADYLEAHDDMAIKLSAWDIRLSYRPN